MKLLYSLVFAFFLNCAGAQVNHTIYVIDSVPAMDDEVRSALNTYKLTFMDGNETDLFANYETYAKMDSIYGKHWVKKLASSMGANKKWSEYVGSTKPITINIDNWNWTKYDFYSIGLIKETQTKTCGYNLRCGIKTKSFSHKGKLTSSKMKNISKDK